MTFRLLPDDKDTGYTPYFWLIYVGLFIFFMVIKRHDLILLTLNSLGLLLFHVL